MARKKRSEKKKRHFFRKLFVLLLVLVALFVAMCFFTETEDEKNAPALTGTVERIPDLELPSPVDGEQIIKHAGYTLSYNEEHEQPSWVAYELTRNEVVNRATERVDNFREDRKVRTGSATLSDYKGSGFDRGHLAPSADLLWSVESMDDSFYMSNMSPQRPEFNRGIWKDLEASVRVNAYNNGRIQVVTGPVLTDGPYDTIGKNEVSVPNWYYKVLLDYEEPEIKAIGFLLKNEGSDKRLESFAVSVDDVEEMTGLDFFPSLPDDIEEKLESSFRTSKWSFDTYLPEGATADENEAAAYVSASSTKDKIWDKIQDIFYELKKTVFEYLDIMDIAKEFGLI